ncbi:MAG: UPF0280 family protein [Candidatus Rokubacteria bacterium]|nr:UPF0280 family protein [Candidatus Rokubacteria bacterium]MBI3107930.1 UPF0280 family protein [Candidatus Rokubacteria bacterium]
MEEYRARVATRGLVSFRVARGESDLVVACEGPLESEARAALGWHRRELEAYIAEHPAFLASLQPVAVHPRAPRIVRAMAEAARAAGVGPMAAVAGALAEAVGRSLLRQSQEVIVENGGDLFVSVRSERVALLDTGPSAFGRALGFLIRPDRGPVGIATSSGTVGGSLSLGRADAACVIARSAALADAAATAVGNAVTGAEGIEAGLARARAIPGILGVVVVVGSRLGAWGQVELVEA